MTPLEAAADLLGTPPLTVLATLGGSQRSDVWRVAVPGGTAIVKSYRQPERRTWRREEAGLTAARGARSPRLVAVCEEPAVVVMEDLGDGHSLADRLMGTDRTAAVRGVEDWARAVGEFQEATRDRVDAFAEALDPDMPVHATMREVSELPGVLEGLAVKHDLPWADAVADALDETAAPLADPQGQRLSPGDTCPDNNLDSGQGLHLLDFEYAEVRHLAWEAAYLRVPWPTCWCAWQLPPAEAARALAVHRDATGAAATDEAVDAATLLWSLLSSSWFLAGALDPGSVNSDTDRRPGRWTMILGRLDVAARLPGPPALTAYAADLRADLAARWGEHPLALAPAFR